MVEENVNIGSLQQGSISETGTNISSTEYIRTRDYVNGVEVFRRGFLECFSTKPRSIEGSTEGITDVRHSVPGFPSTLRNNISTADNGNYEVYYYHYYIHHDDSYYGDNVLWWAGYIALVIPKTGSNVDTEKPWVRMYKENESPTSSANYSTKEKYYESIDVVANTITYYNSGQSGETTTMSLLEFICGSLDSTYHYQAELRCWRLSDIVPCDVALLGYASGNLLVYSERWKSGAGSISNMVDFSSQCPIIRWKFVFHVDGITDLKTEYICNHSFTLVGNSWELNEDDILVNADIPDPIDGDIFTPPYPATMWYMDENSKLKNALLPEEPAEGSFMDCTTLEYVSIPESVQYIGKYAFTHTSLTRVRISRTCTYYPTSFPPGCEIWFYDDEMEPADDFYSKAEIDAMMIRLGILGLELFKISDLETRKISILEGD